MSVRVQKEKSKARQDAEVLVEEAQNQQKSKKIQKLEQDLSDLLDEIDDILATQDENFALTYKQAGGQ